MGRLWLKTSARASEASRGATGDDPKNVSSAAHESLRKPSDDNAEPGAWRGTGRLLCVAALLHLALSVTLYEVGRRGAWPAVVDASGVVVSVAPDAAMFREGAAGLSGALWAGEVRYWFGADYPFHVKLYSICFALFGPWLGYNVLGAEPLNALLYLAGVALAFRIGAEVFGRRAGQLAAVAVALWPSYLLHSTQFLKDSLFVAGFLALGLILVRWLTRNYSAAAALPACAAGALTVVVLWLTRGDWGMLLIATVVIGLLLLVVRQFREGRMLPANLAGAVLLLAAAASVPRIMPQALRLGRVNSPVEAVAQARRASQARANSGRAAGGAAPTTHEASRGPFLSGPAAYVGRMRRGVIAAFPDSGSNVDAGVNLDGMADLLRYLPRAAAVGFFAPFPDMWLSSGARVGSTGRRLAGLESVAMYAVEALALAGLWRGRRRLTVWLLSSVAAAGMTALGLVMANVGALYRLRFVFLSLLIIVAAGAVADALGRPARGPRGERSGAA